MAFDIDDRIEIRRTGYGVPKGSTGTVQHVYQNGNLRVRITHNPGCKEREVGKTIFSVDPADLVSSDCAS